VNSFQDILNRNPWRLPRQNPFVLDADAPRILRYNETVSDQFTLRMDVPPEPFHGNVVDAQVVILMLNPGFHDEDLLYAHDPIYCEQLAQSLLMHPSKEAYPFTPLDPRWAQTPTGLWWRKILSRFVDAVGDKQVAQRLAVLEWYPYHSKSFRYKPQILRVSDATKFNQELAAACIQSDKIVICMRGHDLWTLGGGFDAYELPRPANARCASLTPGNLGTPLFDKIMQRMMHEAR